MVQFDVCSAVQREEISGGDLLNIQNKVFQANVDQKPVIIRVTGYGPRFVAIKCQFYRLVPCSYTEVKNTVMGNTEEAAAAFTLEPA